jgi:hypothetical protein
MTGFSETSVWFGGKKATGSLIANREARHNYIFRRRRNLDSCARSKVASAVLWKQKYLVRPDRMLDRGRVIS